MMAFNLSRAARSRMASNSAFCSGVLSVLRDGQSMFATVATQAPRNSRAGSGGITLEGPYDAACEARGTRSAASASMSWSLLNLIRSFLKGRIMRHLREGIEGKTPSDGLVAG